MIYLMDIFTKDVETKHNWIKEALESGWDYETAINFGKLVEVEKTSNNEWVEVL